MSFSKDITRRHFLIMISSVLTVVVGIIFSWMGLSSVGFFNRRKRILTLDPPEVYPLGTRRIIGEIILIHDREGFCALSSKCTHLGCTLIPTGQGFDCPCHGSRFSIDGRRLAGPATKNLVWYKLGINSRGELIAYLDEIVSYEERIWRA